MKPILILSAITTLVSFYCSGNHEQGSSFNRTAQNKTELNEKIDSLLQGYDFYNRLSGTVLIASKDNVFYLKSFGYADVIKNDINHNASVYGIGSLTKQFTATAVLKLAQEGKLRLTDKLSDYFPALGETATHISIHHLLSMSSGIFEDFSRSKTYDLENVIFPESDPISTHDLVHYFGEITSDSKPGNKFDYSNINYVFLAAIVEKVSGQQYGGYLKTHLWEPLGLDMTVFGMESADPLLLSKPYLGLPGEHKTPEYWHDSWIMGAGGVFSSAIELHKWMYDVNSYSVLDSTHTQKLFQKHTKAGGEHYGYGWKTTTRKGNEYRYHDGGTLGYVCEAGFFPDQDLYMVVLTNHTHDLMEIGRSVRLNKEIVDQLQSILFEEPFTVLPTPAENTSLAFSDRVNAGGFTFGSIQNGNIITISSTDNAPSILDIAFLQDLTEDTRRFRKAEKIAIAFGNEDFRSVLRKSGIMLRVLVSADKISQVWEEITGEKGEFKGYNFYRIPDGKIKSSYWVRLIHEKKEVGLRLTFNKFNKMAGMHIDQSFSFGGPTEVEALVINDSLIFIDGFRYGYPDTIIHKQGDRWVLKTQSAEFVMELL
jgi:CubicO group peptidase (beta-lactamase class C family)